MRYETKGKFPETGEPVTVEVGWSESSGYFFGVDDTSGRELRSKVEILSLPQLMALTADLGIWDRRLFIAMQRAPVDDYCLRHPGTPAAKLITRIR